MMDDLISRQAAIAECDKRGAEHIGYAISKLPSAQPERDVGTCDECIHKDRFDYEPPCKMCIRIASKGRDGDYFCKEGDKR